MPSVLDFQASESDALLIQDSFSKLCNVVFPIEAARAPVVMHYDTPNTDPTLIFLCNAAIHYRRVTPPASMRINGVPTRKYAIVECTAFSEEEISRVIDILNGAQYYAYTMEVNGKTKLYVVWDEKCSTVVDYGAEDGTDPEIPEFGIPTT